MKIVEIASFFPPLGGTFCLDQARALQTAGHDVCVLACNQWGITMGVSRYLKTRWGTWRERIEGVDVYRTNLHALPRCVQWNELHWVHCVRLLYARYKAEHGKPDVIHAHCCQWAGVAAAQISREERIPYFITEHISAGLFEREYGKGWKRHLWAKSLCRDAYEGAGCVIPVADELVDGLSPYFGKAYRHQWISNIVDTDFFAYKGRADRNDRPLRICCLAVANIYLKGFDTLAEAWPRMEGCQLFIAGRGTDGTDMHELFKGKKDVCLMGELDKEAVRSLLYDCDLLVLPSRSEVQPLVLLEAMCTGIPVVTTDIVTRNVQIEDACFMARVGDAGSLAEQMRCALERGPLEETLAEKVRQMVAPHTIASQLAALFAEA